MSNWIANFVYAEEGKKFKYEGRMWTPALFDTDANRRVWKMSRQVGKSTGGCAEQLARSCVFRNFKTLYVCPVQDQAKKFSYDRLTPMMESSPFIERHIGKTQNVYEKEFETKSKIYLKYAKHNPDSIRGITADFIHFDEIQDQDISEIEPVVRECLFTSEHKLRLYTGTPKSLQNPIEKLWQESDQREYLIKCRGCGKYNKLGIRNIGKKGPICHKCGKLLDVDNGTWVRMNRGARTAGFHVNQLNCKISHNSKASWMEIIDKFENTRRSTFLNETLGESADSAETPLTKTVLMRASRNSRVKNEPHPGTSVGGKYDFYAGIDWGHGEAATVLTIGRFSENGVFQFVFMRKYEGNRCQPNICIPDMVNVLKRYRVKHVHCDTGGGFGLNSVLNKRYKQGKITTNTWSSSAKSADRKWSTKNREFPRLTLNRSKSIANFIEKIRDDQIRFFRWSDFHPDFTQDFLNIRKEVRESDDSVKYVRAGCDDAFHASIYAYIIGRIDKF